MTRPRPEDPAMNRSDPVLGCLAALPAAEPPPELSASLRAAAHARLRPRRLHPAWTVAVVVSVIPYMGWALQFAGALY
jgi:uncharacterized membrane protein YccC